MHSTVFSIQQHCAVLHNRDLLHSTSTVLYDTAALFRPLQPYSTELYNTLLYQVPNCRTLLISTTAVPSLPQRRTTALPVPVSRPSARTRARLRPVEMWRTSSASSSSDQEEPTAKQNRTTTATAGKTNNNKKDIRTIDTSNTSYWLGVIQGFPSEEVFARGVTQGKKH